MLHSRVVWFTGFVVLIILLSLCCESTSGFESEDKKYGCQIMPYTTKKLELVKYSNSVNLRGWGVEKLSGGVEIFRGVEIFSGEVEIFSGRGAIFSGGVEIFSGVGS